MKVSANLHVEDIMHPRMVDQFGLMLCRKVLKERRWYLLETYEQIRELAGEHAMINNYGDDLAYRKAISAGHPGYSVIKGRNLHINNGVRIFSDPVGKDLSANYLWDAMILRFPVVEPAYIKQWILDYSDDYPYIIKIGSDEALHVEVAKVRLQDIEVFNP